MDETSKVCSKCSHFGPNKLEQFKYRLQAEPKCWRTKIPKPVTWNPEKKGCDHFDDNG